MRWRYGTPCDGYGYADQVVCVRQTSSCPEAQWLQGDSSGMGCADLVCTPCSQDCGGVPGYYLQGRKNSVCLGTTLYDPHECVYRECLSGQYLALQVALPDVNATGDVEDLTCDNCTAACPTDNTYTMRGFCTGKSTYDTVVCELCLDNNCMCDDTPDPIHGVAFADNFHRTPSTAIYLCFTGLPSMWHGEARFGRR